MTIETVNDQKAIRERIVPKDIMSILGYSRAQAYNVYNKYRKALKIEDSPLTVDQFCKLTNLDRSRVILHLKGHQAA